MNRLFHHLRSLWPGAGIWLPLPFVLWTGGSLALGSQRWEHAGILLGVPLLAYASVATKRLFLGVLPMGLLGLVYDAMRFVKDLGVTEQRVHVCDLRAIDMAIASVMVGGVRGTVHDWIQLHTSLAVEVMCAVPYGTFIFLAFGFAVFLYRRHYDRLRLFGWAFLLVNLAGFATYHLYPAAPPWYFHQHGCAVDLAALPSEGASLARVDALLGFPYFHGFYGRASDVFGAVPSLHVAYPMLVVLFGWPILRWPGRTFTLTFLVSMCTAAVYLDHHWIIDLVLGLAYTVVVVAALLWFVRPRRASRDVIRGAAGELGP